MGPGDCGPRPCCGSLSESGNPAILAIGDMFKVKMLPGSAAAQFAVDGY